MMIDQVDLVVSIGIHWYPLVSDTAPSKCAERRALGNEIRSVRESEKGMVETGDGDHTTETRVATDRARKMMVFMDSRGIIPNIMAEAFYFR